MVHYAAFILETERCVRRTFRERLLWVVAAISVVGAFATPVRSQTAADPNKIVHVSFPTGESGFDPVRISDLYSATVIEAIFERLLTYDYLARPAKLVPMLAEAMPEIADNGKTYTFRLRKGVYFAPDPAFKGKRRELVAQDVVYSYHALPRPEEPRALRVPARGQDRRARRAGRAGEEDGQVRLRREDSRDGSARPLHAALPAQGNGLQLPLHRRPHLARRRRARSDRSLSATIRWRIRSAPDPTC